MLTSWITFIFIIVVSLKFELCFGQCRDGEYEMDTQCCPMCGPGYYVFHHCTLDTNTVCYSCPEITFIDQPNGLVGCIPCAVCDANRGLKVNKACTRSSDTVCEPLERFYCIQKNKDSCTFAAQHSECRPGQYIKQAGTDSTDTVCADCTGDTYSNGSFSSCVPHTKCEAIGLVETNPGTHSSNTKCVNPSTASRIRTNSAIVTLILIIVVSVLTIISCQKNKK